MINSVKTYTSGSHQEKILKKIRRIFACVSPPVEEKKRVTEDEMAGWHHQLNGHEFEQIPCSKDRKPGMLQSMGSQELSTTQ